MSKYVGVEHGTFPFPAIRMGKKGEPVVHTEGGVKANETITFSPNPTAADTITINGIVVEFTAGGSDATAAGTIGDPLLVNIKASTTLTLDEVTIVCNNGSAPAAMQLATYSNDATTLTSTYDSYGVVGHAFTLAASAATADGATLSGGQEIPDDRSAFGPTDFSLTQAVNQDFLLGDGDESQRKLMYCSVQSGAGEAVVTPTSLSGGTTITFTAAGQYSELIFMGGQWVQIDGTATVA